MNVCPNCQTITTLDVCPKCDLILVGKDKGKEKRDEPHTKPEKKDK